MSRANPLRCRWFSNRPRALALLVPLAVLAGSGCGRGAALDGRPLISPTPATAGPATLSGQATIPAVICEAALAEAVRDRWIVFDSDRDQSFRRQLYAMRSDGSAVARVLTSADSDKEPSYAPDGRRMVFTREIAGHPQIHLLDLATRTVTQVTHRPEGADQGSFSHAGQQLAFRSGESVYVIAPDGSHEQLVATGGYRWPQFSGDDSELIFDRNNEIDARPIAGGPIRGIVQNWTTTIEAPAVSPDGHEVAHRVHCDFEGASSIWTTPAATKTYPCKGRRVTPPGDAAAGRPAWAGAAALAYERVEQTTNLAAIALVHRAAGSRPCILTAALTDNRNPTVSPPGAPSPLDPTPPTPSNPGGTGAGPDGGAGADAQAPGLGCSAPALASVRDRWIAFDSDRAPGFVRQLYAVHPDGSGLVRLHTSTHADREPAYAPDGQRIAFSSDRAGLPQIFLLDLASQKVTQVTQRPAGADQPSFSHDGALIAFHSGPSVYVIQPDGAGERRIATGLDEFNAYFSPHFSRDDRQLVFDRNNEIDAVALSGEGLRYVVSNTTTTIKAPAVSPDGREVAYHAICGPDPTQVSIWSTPFASSTQVCMGRRVTPANEPSAEHPAWGTDAVLAYERVDRTTNLALLAVITRDAGGAPCPVTAPGADSRNPAWSP